MSDEPEDIEGKPKRQRRPVRRFGFWKFLSIILLSSLLFLAGLSLTGRKLTMPAWVTAQFEIRANGGLENGHITLGRLQFQVDETGIPRVLLGNLGVFDDRGVELVRLNDVGVRLSFPALFRGQIKPDSIFLAGAQMTLRRLVDGRFDISLGAGTAASGTLPGVLDIIDQGFSSGPLDTLNLLDATDLTITLEDARSGRLWQITEGALQLRRLEDGLDISVAFDVFNGTEELAETVVGVRTKFSDSSATFGSSFKNAAAADIALQSPALSFLGVLNAPISGAVRTEFDLNGVLGSFAGTLEIGAGALQPNADVEPLHFDSAKAYFEFDPEALKLEFSQVSVVSDTITLVAQGQAYMRDLQDGWPSTLLGQFTLSDLKAHPKGLYEEPVEFSQGAADFRLRLNPFSVDVGQFVLLQGDEKLVANGKVKAGADGWEVASDFTLNEMSLERLLTLWPVSVIPKTRGWLLKNINSGLLSDIRGAIRVLPGQEVRNSVGWNFNNTSVRYMRAQPVVENAQGYGKIDGKMFTIVLEGGSVTPPLGGEIDLNGSTFQIPDLTIIPADLKVRLKGSSTTTAALSLMDEKPFRILRNASFGPDLAEGRVNFSADVDFKLKGLVEMEDVTYSVNGVLSDVRTTKLIPGRILSANRLTLMANNDTVEIGGPVRLGLVAADIIWHQDMGPEYAGKSSVDGTVELGHAFVKEFKIGLPDNSVRGKGLAQFDIAFEKDVAPRFTLTSDLNRVGLRIDQIGWSKPRNGTGKLDVAGNLGARPGIDRLEIRAAGLNASGGQVTLAPDGSMQSVTFSRVQVGGWLDAPISLRGRGANVAPAVSMIGGTIDVRETTIGGAKTSTSGAGGPISISKASVIVSQGMTLTNFNGEFNSAGGLSGNFTARMNGNTRLKGQLEPEKNGTAVRIQSSNAGGVIRDAGVVEYANRGELDLTLRPQKTNGVYIGTMKITNTRVLNAPGMTDLLSAISIVGLLDQLSGEGISFDKVEARFRLTPKYVHLTRSSAVGPSLGVSLDGVYDLTTSTMDMQGVVSPVYFLNAIGRIFSRKGEGLFGFNFRITGTSEAPKVGVNPLSILTPGLFRDIFRAPPPELPQ